MSSIAAHVPKVPQTEFKIIAAKRKMHQIYNRYATCSRAVRAFVRLAKSSSRVANTAALFFSLKHAMRGVQAVSVADFDTNSLHPASEE